MSPSDLHLTASFIRERYTPPDPTRMSPGQYVSHEAMHALADALAQTAHLTADRPTEGQQTADDAMLRREALDLAIRSLRGDESSEEIGGRAEAFLKFLRGERAAS